MSKKLAALLSSKTEYYRNCMQSLDFDCHARMLCMMHAASRDEEPAG